MTVKRERKCWSDLTDGGCIQGKKCRAAAGKVQIGCRLWKNHKAKAIAVGFVILYQKWRHEEKKERKEKIKLMNERDRKIEEKSQSCCFSRVRKYKQRWG